LRENLAAVTTEESGVGFDLVVASNQDLPVDDFNAQVEMIKRVASWNGVTLTWHSRVSADNLEWGAKVLNQLFEAARLYGAFVRVGNES
jgi:hypothetical protein